MRATRFTNGHAEVFAAIFLATALGPSIARAAAGESRVHAGGADAYILARGGSSFSTNTSLEEVQSLRERLSGEFLWARRSGKEYLIRDRKTLEEAADLFSALTTLDPDRSDLERRQSALESEESELDREQEKLERQLDRISDDSDSAEASEDAERTALEGRQRELESRMRAVEAKQRDLEPLERSLDAREEEIERKAESALWRLVDRSIASGLARPASGR